MAEWWGVRKERTAMLTIIRINRGRHKSDDTVLVKVRYNGQAHYETLNEHDEVQFDGVNRWSKVQEKHLFRPFKKEVGHYPERIRCAEGKHELQAEESVYGEAIDPTLRICFYCGARFKMQQKSVTLTLEEPVPEEQTA